MLRLLSVVVVLTSVAPVLADPPARSTNLEVAMGQVKLMEKAMDDALEHLQSGDLQQLAKAYRRFALAHGRLADLLAQGQIALGSSRVRLELARAHLTRLQASPKDTARQPRVDLPLLREEVMRRLQALLDRHEAACEKDKPMLLVQMDNLLEFRDSLDRYKDVPRTSTLPALPASLVSRLEKTIAFMEEQVELEERLHKVMSENVQTTLMQLPRHLHQAVLLVRADGPLPREELRQLRQHRRAFVDFLGELRSVRKEVTDAQVGVASKTPVPEAPADTLARVKEVLNGN